jgi:hypothetical protein
MQIVFRQILVLFSCLLLIGAAKTNHFQISGLQGEVLKNVQNRLNELYNLPMQLTDLPTTYSV